MLRVFLGKLKVASVDHSPVIVLYRKIQFPLGSPLIWWAGRARSRGKWSKGRYSISSDCCATNENMEQKSVSLDLLWNDDRGSCLPRGTMSISSRLINGRFKAALADFVDADDSLCARMQLQKGFIRSLRNY
jgi:hypothetical protein